MLQGSRSYSSVRNFAGDFQEGFFVIFSGFKNLLKKALAELALTEAPERPVIRVPIISQNLWE